MSLEEKRDDLRSRIADAFIAFELATSAAQRAEKRKALFWVIEEALALMGEEGTR